MTRKTTTLLFPALLLTAVMAAASPGDSTNGHGTFTTGGSTVVSFVFDAKETGSGAITGRARIFDNGAFSLDLAVNCLIIGGDTAIIGGTDVANPSTTYAFKVTDNGGGATADRITLLQTNQTCATFSALSSFVLTSGDVEVRDQP